MSLSARNRLAGTVTGVETDGLMAEVTVELGDGQEVTAVITSGSVERLGIEEGKEVNAVVKATEVMVEAEPGE
ncbi:molybdopterin-binding protein [Halobium salinum]|uniref:Molybdopterin-binding protein n=1 Tax=Halobium salinum TaxID=1364940 RepID=A0ABD5P875_9EURY|nr:TOBE domain-containing protein [Halobium salinum]